MRDKSIDMLHQSHDINTTDYTTPYGGHKVVVRVYIIYLMSCVHKIAYCVLRCYSVFQGSESNPNTDEGSHPANNPLLDIIGGCCGARWSVYTDCSGVNVMLHWPAQYFFYFLRGHVTSMMIFGWKMMELTWKIIHLHDPHKILFRSILVTFIIGADTKKLCLFLDFAQKFNFACNKTGCAKIQLKNW